MSQMKSVLAALYALLRLEFYAFIRKVFQSVDPGKQWIDAWSVDAIAHHLELCRRGDCKRLIITLPPRSLKSIAASVAFPAFVLGHDPCKRILCISYSNDLALKHARDFREVVTSPWYRSVFPGVAALRDVEDSFETTQRGIRDSSSFASGVTGKGYDIIIIDDPMKADEAASKTQREKAIEFYSSALYSRLNNKNEGVIIVVTQRVHDEDLVGHLIKQGGWTHLNLPAIADDDAEIPISDGKVHARKKGDILNPDRESLASLEATKRTLGSAHFQAQYQQKPIPDGGNMIQRPWLKYYKQAPDRRNGRVVQSWDTAMKGQDINDYSVGTTWLNLDDKHFLIDLVRRHCDYPTLRRLIMDQHAKHRPDALLIEDHGSGAGLIADLKRENIRAIPILPVGDKIVRLSIASPRFESGEVFLPENAAYLPEYLDELLRFPQVKFDDQVDSTTQYLIWHRDNMTKPIFDVYWT